VGRAPPQRPPRMAAAATVGRAPGAPPFGRARGAATGHPRRTLNAPFCVAAERWVSALSTSVFRVPFTFAFALPRLHPYRHSSAMSHGVEFETALVDTSSYHRLGHFNVVVVQGQQLHLLE